MNENKTVLTNTEMVDIAKQTESADPGRDGYVLPISFGRAIERAVLDRIHPAASEATELRNRVMALEAARIAYASEFPPNADGEPDVGSIHANIRALKAKVSASDHEFKNFHRALCERFDYCHDERDWKRDQVSLIEHIAKKIGASEVNVWMAAVVDALVARMIYEPKDNDQPRDALRKLLDHAASEAGAVPVEPSALESSIRELDAWEANSDGYVTPAIGESIMLVLHELKRMRAAPPAESSQPAEPKWRCFHCDELFATEGDAALHFGKSEFQQPACAIDITEYRAMEARMRSYNDEDAEIHREMARLRHDHAQALRSEEEKGYARGLADAAKEPTAATADAQVIAIGLDGLVCEHCGDGHTELTFEEGEFACNCDTCSADCQYFAVERLNALVKPKDAQGDERALYEALELAHSHLEMAALRVSHAKDAAIITAALSRQPSAGDAEDALVALYYAAGNVVPTESDAFKFTGEDGVESGVSHIINLKCRAEDWQAFKIAYDAARAQRAGKGEA